ncbi:MAG: hypothetical protein KTR14_01215 [Vampirovibrio sp.]|nr:hypothetical protein [Vampirovibrio sp.]
MSGYCGGYNHGGHNYHQSNRQFRHGYGHGYSDGSRHRPYDPQPHGGYRRRGHGGHHGHHYRHDHYPRLRNLEAAGLTGLLAAEVTGRDEPGIAALGAALGATRRDPDDAFLSAALDTAMLGIIAGNDDTDVINDSVLAALGTRTKDVRY